MSIGVFVHMKDLDDFEKSLHNIGKDFSKRKYLHTIGNLLLRWINQNFVEEGKEAKWKPLSLSTIMGRRKGKGGGGPRILQDTGRLRMSFVKVVSESGQWVEVGTKDVRGAIHHFGTRPFVIFPNRKRFLRFMGSDGKWRYARKVHHPGIPARPILPSEGLAVKVARDELVEYVERVLKENAK